MVGKNALNPKSQKYISEGGNRKFGSYAQWLASGGAGGPVRQEGEQATGGGNFQPDLSNQFSGNVKMDLNQQLANMANLWGGGGQAQQPTGEDQTRNLQLLIDYMKQNQVRPAEAYQAEAQAYDPVRYAQQQYEARLATDPWGPGGQFAGRRAADLYTPEEILASQGNTAQNQILRNRQPISPERSAQLAGVPEAQRANAGEFDPTELIRQNQIYRNSRTYF